MTSMIPCGDFKTGYSADTTIFPTTTSRNMVIFGIAVLCLAPPVMDKYALSLLIQFIRQDLGRRRTSLNSARPSVCARVCSPAEGRQGARVRCAFADDCERSSRG